jgi:hypothetical protein
MIPPSVAKTGIGDCDGLALDRFIVGMLQALAASRRGYYTSGIYNCSRHKVKFLGSQLTIYGDRTRAVNVDSPKHHDAVQV